MYAFSEDWSLYGRELFHSTRGTSIWNGYFQNFSKSGKSKLITLLAPFDVKIHMLFNLYLYRAVWFGRNEFPLIKIKRELNMSVWFIKSEIKTTVGGRSKHCKLHKKLTRATSYHRYGWLKITESKAQNEPLKLYNLSKDLQFIMDDDFSFYIIGLPVYTVWSCVSES